MVGSYGKGGGFMSRDINDVPRMKAMWESRWGYAVKVYQQGEKDNSDDLKETALHCMKVIFAELQRADYSFTDLDFPDVTFFRHKIYPIITTHVQ